MVKLMNLYLRVWLLYWIFTNSNALEDETPSWDENWLVNPPESSSAFCYVETNLTGQIKIHETIPVDGNITASLHFKGEFEELKQIRPACPFEIKKSESGADILLKEALDYETNILFTCVYQLGNTNVKLVYLEVIDDNDCYPQFTTNPGTIGPFPENKEGLIFTFKAEDRDKDDNARLIYSFEVVQGSGSHFAMKIAGNTNKSGELMVVQPLDFETEEFYLLQITVKDREEGGLSSRIQVSLNVDDVPDMPPIWGNLIPIIHIAEELEEGTEIYQVIAKDGDRKINNEISYTLKDNGDKFMVNENSGMVSLVSRIDRESLENSYFDLVIIATEVQQPNSTSSTSTTVFIDDINDNSPNFSQPEYVFYVDEDFYGQLSEQDITVSDPDLKENGTFIVSIVTDNDNVRANLKLSPSGGIQTANLFLSVNEGLLDYEDASKRNISLQLEAVETSKEAHTGSASVRIISRDVNDCDPVFVNTDPTKGTYQIHLKENVKEGEQVIQIEATDNDASPQFGKESIIYSFLESKASFYFKVDAKSGMISTLPNAPFDYERETSLSFIVTATDMNGTSKDRQYPRSAKVSLDVVIEDVNDEPPTLSPSNPSSAQVSENAKKEFAVFSSISASDRDSNSDLQLSIDWQGTTFIKNGKVIADAPEKVFEVKLDRQDKSSSNWSIRVGDPPSENEKSLSWEQYDTVQLKIVVTDCHTEVNCATDEATLEIEILDFNDHDPSFDQSKCKFSVVENTTYTTSFGSVLATDVDKYNDITYSISWCSNDGKDYVAIDASSGELILIKELDYEATQSVECNVTATDSDPGNPRSTTVKIEIEVIDINDCTPMFDYVPENPIYVDENTKSGIIGHVHATDDDSGNFGTVTYLFTPFSTEGLDQFVIDPSTGDISIKPDAILDFEDHPQPFTISIDARDNYREHVLSGSNWATSLVKIQLKDVNDNSPILPPSNFIQCFTSPIETMKKGETIVEIIATDSDEPGTPNSQITYTLEDQSHIDGTVVEKNLFRFKDADHGVLVADINLIDLNGNYSVTIKATDRGNPPKSSDDVKYRICIQDFNNNLPIFDFPSRKGLIVNVRENSTVGAPVMYENSDGMSQELIIMATDKDPGENGRVSYEWTDATSPAASVFELHENGQVILSKKFDRAQTNSYDLGITARDHGYSFIQSTPTVLKLDVRKVSQFPPAFPTKNSTLSFTENESEIISFPESIDPDNTNLLPNEIGDPICYYIACGNAEIFKIVDKRNASTVRHPLDREKPPADLFFVVESTNDCTKQPDPIRSFIDCVDVDTSSLAYLNVSVEILDENDNAPIFDGTMSGGILAGNQIDTVIFPLSVFDPDLDDTARFSLGEFSYSDDSLSQVTNPFKLQDSTNNVVLNFEVQSNMKGHFTVNVSVEDAVGHETRDLIKIFIVTPENQVSFKFDNPESKVQENRKNIEDIFTRVYKLLCNVESIKGDSNATSVLSHFVDEAKDEPVSSSRIQTFKLNSNMTDELKYEFRNVGLLLKDIESNDSDTSTVANLYLILFIVSCVIIPFLAAWLIVLIIKSEELNRTVSALSAMKFGSQSSNINRISDNVFNTNVNAVEGANPIWQHSQSDFKSDGIQNDNISVSSGDSILIGVENDPEFRSYDKTRGNWMKEKRRAPSPPLVEASRFPRGIPDISEDDVGPYQSVDDSPASQTLEGTDSNFTFGDQHLDSMF